MEIYPADIRAWIARRGGLTPRMMFLRGSDLAAIVPPCGGEAQSRVARSRPTGPLRQVVRADLRQARVVARQ
jgi:hypothetical protein